MRTIKVKQLPIWLGLVFTVIFSESCKKLVSVNAPATDLNAANVYSSDATAISVLTGLYTSMSTPGNDFTGNPGISLYLGLSADEFTLFNGISNSNTLYFYYTNALYSNASGSEGSDFWSPLYYDIYVTNSAIAGLTTSNSLTPSIKQQLLGESYFLRAFYNFYLVNLFGSCPLAMTSNYSINSTLGNTSEVVIYQQIVTDLKQAQGLLSSEYLDGNLNPYTPGNIQKARPTKWAAMALLAKTYLYTQDWIDAETEADSLINNGSLFSLNSLSDVFLENSNEAIWQLQPVNSQENTADAWIFVLPSTGPDNTHPVYLSSQLLNSFEPLDQRRYNWVDSITVSGTTYYFPYKYKSATPGASLTEYLMVFRLGEQYLIRSEARAEQGNVGGAQADLNIIRSRAGLANTSASNKTSLLSALMYERQVELFSEWGNRWLDLKRTNSVDPIMTQACPQKNNAMWNAYQQLYPIPYSDIISDPNLKQNPGY